MMATGTEYLGIGVAIGCLTTLISIAFVLVVARRSLRMALFSNKEPIYRELPFPQPAYRNEFPNRTEPLYNKTFQLNITCCLSIHPFVAAYLGRDNEVEAVPDVPESTFDEAQLEALAGPPPDWATWSGGLAKARTRVDTARRFLAQYLLARMLLDGNPDDTLLPPNILRCFQELEKTTLFRPSVKKPYLSIWRETTYQLAAMSHGLNIYEAIGEVPFIEGDSREGRVKQVAAELRDALKLDVIVRQVLLHDLDFHLEYMVGRAANIALAMFGQPGEWYVEWETDQPGHLWFPKVVLTDLGKPMLYIRGNVEPRWTDKDSWGWVHEDCKLHWGEYYGGRKAIPCSE